MKAQGGNEPLADGAKIKLEADKSIVEVGEDTALTVAVEEAGDLYGIELDIDCDSSLFEFKSLELLEPLRKSGANGEGFLMYSDQGGELRIAASRLGGVQGIDGNADLLRIVFTSRQQDDRAILATDGIAISDSRAVTTAGSDGTYPNCGGGFLCHYGLGAAFKCACRDRQSARRQRGRGRLCSESRYEQDGRIDNADLAYVAVRVLQAKQPRPFRLKQPLIRMMRRRSMKISKCCSVLLVIAILFNADSATAEPKNGGVPDQKGVIGSEPDIMEQGNSQTETSAALVTLGKELAHSKPITATSEVTSVGRVAANANDGDLSTQWESAAADLGYARFTGTSNSNPSGIQFTEPEVYQDPNLVSPELPDLSVSSIHLSPSAPEPGDEVTFSAVVCNDGTGTLAESNIRVDFTLNPAVSDTAVTEAVYTGSLEPGETVSVTGTASWTASIGTYALQAKASADVQETHNQNNARMTYFAVRKPASERTDFEERAEYILQTLASSKPTQTNRTLWVKEAVYHAQARFELGVDVETALDYIASINNNFAGASMFYYTANIDTYLKYGHLYPESLREKVKANMLAADYSNNGSTENHFLEFRTAGYLVAQTWPEWSKAQATKAFAERDISEMLQRFVKYGMKEYDSTTYWALYVECLLMLHDLADDPQMKQKAKMALDWMQANTAAEWVDGYWVSSTNRDYMGMSPKLGAAGTIMGWLYFGGEEQPRLLVNELNYPEGMYSIVAAVSSYRIPDPIQSAVADRDGPYTNLESHDQYPTSKLNWPYGYRKTSYIAERYGVASQFDGYGRPGW
ncbi:CARDB domain-containing protein, partial [Paenibacillus zanthoxyli]|uniref:CARDB domain-containing protein n=1 Tax=Paenibacillus zanthoxyli TaxID=369399 RepID=UPI000565F3B5